MHARALQSLFAAALLLTTSIGATDDTAHLIHYPPAADFLVLDVEFGGPVNSDGVGAFTLIYGDGRVLVHRPSFYHESGTFETWLTLPDLDRLLRHLATEGVLDFDSHAVKKQRMAAELERLQKVGTVPGIADAATITLKIHLDRYAPPGVDPPIEDYRQQIWWYALEEYAEWYPEIESLVRLHHSVLLLRDLTNDATVAAASQVRAVEAERRLVSASAH